MPAAPRPLPLCRLAFPLLAACLWTAACAQEAPASGPGQALAGDSSGDGSAADGTGSTSADAPTADQSGGADGDTSAETGPEAGGAADAAVPGDAALPDSTGAADAAEPGDVALPDSSAPADTSQPDTAGPGDTSADTAADTAPLGPTDYVLQDLQGVPAKISVIDGFGNKTLTVTVANLGKAGANAAMAPQLWLSSQPTTAAAGSVQLTAFLVATVGNFAAPATKTLTLTTTAQQGFTFLNAINVTNFKYMCVKLGYPAGMNGPDGNLANNEVCAPAELRASDDAVVELVDPLSKASLAGSTLEIGVAKKIGVSLKNLDDFAQGSAAWTVWLSTDAQASAGDVKLAAGTTALGAAGSALAEVMVTAPANTASLKFLCASLDSYKLYPAWNPNAANDALCVPVTIGSAPDLAVTALEPPSLSVGSGQVAGLSYGSPWNCLGMVENLGTAGSAPFDIGCRVRAKAGGNWLLKYTKTVANFAVGGKHSLLLPNPEVTAALLPDGALGANSLELCITADPDGKVAEKSEANNEKCAAIGLYGANYATTKVTVNNQGTGAALKLGAIVAINWSIKNTGNYKSMNSFKGRIYLSKDKTLSSEDTLWITPPAYVGGINPGLEVYLLHPTIMSGQMPATYALGDAYLLFQVDADAQVAESSEGDNLLALPIQVVP